MGSPDFKYTLVLRVCVCINNYMCFRFDNSSCPVNEKESFCSALFITLLNRCAQKMLPILDAVFNNKSARSLRSYATVSEAIVH